MTIDNNCCLSSSSVLIMSDPAMSIRPHYDQLIELLDTLVTVVIVTVHKIIYPPICPFVSLFIHPSTQ